MRAGVGGLISLYQIKNSPKSKVLYLVPEEKTYILEPDYLVYGDTYITGYFGLALYTDLQKPLCMEAKWG